MVIIITTISIWSLVLVFIAIIPCRPVSGFWRTDIDATCIPTLPLWYINAAGNIVTDIIIFALPIPVVWKLKMPPSERLSLIGVFCLGFLSVLAPVSTSNRIPIKCAPHTDSLSSTCTISVVRIDFLNLGKDFTYENIASAGWSLGELCAGLTCACLPTLRPLLFRVVTQPLKRVTVSRNTAPVSSLQLKTKLSISLSSKKANSELEDEVGEHDVESARARKAGSEDTLPTHEEALEEPEVLEGDATGALRSQVFRNVM